MVVWQRGKGSLRQSHHVMVMDGRDREKNTVSRHRAHDVCAYAELLAGRPCVEPRTQPRHVVDEEVEVVI
eukprot:6744701-Prymnesium_polylepis.1